MNALVQAHGVQTRTSRYQAVSTLFKTWLHARLLS
jgi:hypothetical protein